MVTDGWRTALRDARRARGLSQHQLAALARLSKDAIRGYETGRRMPTRDHLAAVLDALKLDVGQRNHISKELTPGGSRPLFAWRAVLGGAARRRLPKCSPHSLVGEAASGSGNRGAARCHPSLRHPPQTSYPTPVCTGRNSALLRN